MNKVNTIKLRIPTEEEKNELLALLCSQDCDEDCTNCKDCVACKSCYISEEDRASIKDFIDYAAIAAHEGHFIDHNKKYPCKFMVVTNPADLEKTSIYSWNHWNKKEDGKLHEVKSYG